MFQFCVSIHICVEVREDTIICDVSFVDSFHVHFGVLHCFDLNFRFNSRDLCEYFVL